MDPIAQGEFCVVTEGTMAAMAMPQQDGDAVQGDDREAILSGKHKEMGDSFSKSLSDASHTEASAIKESEAVVAAKAKEIDAKEGSTGILKEMGDSFSKSLSDASDAEANAIKESDAVVAARAKEIDAKEGSAPAHIWQYQEKSVTRKLGWIDMDPTVSNKLNDAMHDYLAVSPGPDDPLPVVYYTDKGGSRKWCADLRTMTQTRYWPDGSGTGATSKIRQIALLRG